MNNRILLFFAVTLMLSNATFVGAQSYYLDLIYPNQCVNSLSIDQVFEHKGSLKFFAEGELYSLDGKQVEPYGLNVNKQLPNRGKVNSVNGLHWYISPNNVKLFLSNNELSEGRQINLPSQNEYSYIIDNLEGAKMLVTPSGLKSVKGDERLSVKWKTFGLDHTWQYDVESNGRTWLINTAGGIYLFEKDYSSVAYRTIYNSTKSNALYIDDSDIVWLALDQKLIGVRNDSILQDISVRGIKKIQKIKKDKNNVLWVLNNTLSFVHPKTLELKQIFNQEEFPGIVVNDFEISEDQSIWIATNQGLYYHPGPQLSFYNLAKKPDQNFRKQFFVFGKDKFLSKGKQVFKFDLESSEKLQDQSLSDVPYYKKYDFGANRFSLFYQDAVKDYDISSHTILETQNIGSDYIIDKIKLEEANANLILQSELLFASENPDGGVVLSDIKYDNKASKLIPYNLSVLADKKLLTSNVGIFEIQVNTNNKVNVSKVVSGQDYVASTPVQPINYYDCVLVPNDSLINIVKKDESGDLAVDAFKVIGGKDKILDLKNVNDQLWIATNNHIIGYNLDTLCFLNKYQSNYIIPFPEYQQEISLDYDKDSILWIFNSKKLIKFDNSLLAVREQVKKQKLLSTIDITQSDNEKNLFARNLSSQGKDVTVQVDVNKFQQLEGVVYQYRIKSISDNWQDIPNDGNIIIERIPYGSTELEIRACDIDNNCTIMDAGKIDVSRPLLSNPLFYLGLLFILPLIAYLFFKNYQNRVRTKQKLEAQLIATAMQAEEEEKRRITSEIHDGLGQSLILLKNKALLRGDREYAQMVDNTILDMRGLLTNIRPAEIDKIGLKKALEEMVDRLDKNSSIFFSHDINDIDDYLTNTQKHHLYRIVQEAFNNIIKHSGATGAKVSARTHNNEMFFFIMDNGKGISAEDIELGSGQGVLSIKNRVSHLGGKLSFNPVFPKGLELAIQFPISKSK